MRLFEPHLTFGPPPLTAVVLAGGPGTKARLILLSALTRAGYRVRVADTGDDLLREALADGVALIIAEIRLQSENGKCAVEMLESIPELRDIPVIAYSESGALGDEALAHTVGVAAFLRDPMSAAALLDTVDSLLGPSPMAITREFDVVVQ